MKYKNLKDYYEAQVKLQIEERGLMTDSDFDQFSSSYLHWYGQLQGSINGWDWTETASYQNSVYRECEGDETTTIKPGLSYQQLIERYAGSVLEKVKFCSLTWTHDNKGIFYGCYPDHTSDASGRNTEQQNKQKLFFRVII